MESMLLLETVFTDPSKILTAIISLIISVVIGVIFHFIFKDIPVVWS